MSRLTREEDIKETRQSGVGRELTPVVLGAVASLLLFFLLFLPLSYRFTAARAMAECGGQRDKMGDVAYSTFIHQRLALEGKAGREITPFALVMHWARWLYEEYLPQGRVLRFLASNMALFAVGCVLLYATPGTFIPTPSLLNGGGTVWVFTGSELAFLLASVCFSMICLVDLSVIISTENPLKRQLVWVIFCINLQAALYGHPLPQTLAQYS